MNVLVASDSYKGSLSSSEVFAAVRNAAERIGGINVSGLPIADGGEGTLDALFNVMDGERIVCEATNPLGRKISAYYGIFGTTAVVEMAVSSGLTLVEKENRNPYITTSYGFGEIISHALNNPLVQEVIVGIGGSATNDGGIGMAQALGLLALNVNGENVSLGGWSLKDIIKLDCSRMHPRLKEVSIRAMCDVNNPLCGANGASAIYGPQKGATPEMVAQLDGNLWHLANLIQRDIGRNVLDLPGGGAAGGVGAGLQAFCNARLDPGIEVMLDLVRFGDLVQNVDLVLTGEGKTDFQTAFGKVIVGVAKRSRLFDKTVVCLSGALGEKYQELHEVGIDAFFSICPRPVTEQEAMTNAYVFVTEAVENIFRLYGKGRRN